MHTPTQVPGPGATPAAVVGVGGGVWGPMWGGGPMQGLAAGCGSQCGLRGPVWGAGAGAGLRGRPARASRVPQRCRALVPPPAWLSREAACAPLRALPRLAPACRCSPPHSGGGNASCIRDEVSGRAGLRRQQRAESPGRLRTAAPSHRRRRGAARGRGWLRSAALAAPGQQRAAAGSRRHAEQPGRLRGRRRRRQPR